MAILAELISNVPDQGKLQLVSLSASEGLSRPFEYQVEFLSPKPDLKLADFLGQSMTVALDLPDNKKRHFNGLVGRFSQSGRRTKAFFHYQAVLRPWFWFLSRTQDCRIFQNMTVKQIVDKVLEDHSTIAKIDPQLSGKYTAWDYCVQYRESDMNFIARLLEQEGIYYYFRHSSGSHEMVLCDGPSSHSVFPGYETISYAATWAEGDQSEALRTWSIGAQVLPSSVVLADFDFLNPGTPLSETGKVERTHALNLHEVFDYPGEYQTGADGTHYAKMRAEEQQASFVLASGDSDARGLCCGHTFKAKSLPDVSQDAEYLVLSTDIYLEEGLQIGGEEGSLGQFNCNFQLMPTSNTYRAPRVTPKPMIHGPQTAMVVGPSGKAVHTDEHGRVKVLFHWDRLGAKAKDSNSSCWVRVSQPWAGKGFGMINIPRVGDEVVVSFLEADPDQPLITGRVYNKDFKRPYPLPEKASITGLLTRSLGSNNAADANELRFDDDPGKEYIWLQAQRDFHREVENDEHDTVKVDQYISVGGKRLEAIGKDLEQTVNGIVKTNYAKDHHHKVGGDLISSAGGVINLKSGGNFALQVTGKAGLDVSTGLDIKVINGDAKLQANNIHIKGMMGVTIEAMSMLTFKVGGASIVMNPGMITIDAGMVSINGGGSGGAASAAAPDKPAVPQEAKVPEVDKDPLAEEKKSKNIQ
jgi:type VI secretion system secreted protein VgrG